MTPVLPFFAAAPMADPAPPPAIPAELAARPGRIATVTATTPGPAVRWLVVGDDVDLRPLPPDGKVTLFVAPKPGRYVLFAWTSSSDGPTDASRCVVTVAEPPPPPRPDPLALELRALYAADATPEKARHLAQLAAVYREAVGFADRADVATAGELARRLRAAAASLLPADALTGVRRRVAEEVGRSLPDGAERPLDAATRAEAGRLFARVAAALEELK